MRGKLPQNNNPIRVSGSARILLYVLLSVSIKTQAQQTPLFSAYHFNRFLVNPAFSGIDNEYRAFGFYRSQWGNMPGRPITGGATIEASFWKDRIGTGLLVMNDQIGIFNQTNISLSYAQKIRFAKEHQISIGVQGTAFLNRIDFTLSKAADFNDPSLADQKLTKAVFDLNVGISYRWRGLLIGFSVPQVLQPNAKYLTNSAGKANYKFIRHYNAFAQYRINLFKGKFNITPTLFMRKAASSGFQFDATLLLDYNNIVFAGAGYRNSFGVVTMVGVNIKNKFTVAYAFDFTTQRTLSGQVGSTHEITAGFHLPSNYKRKSKKESREPTKLDVMLADVQHSNDSLAHKLRYSKQREDSLVKVIKALSSATKEKQNENKTNSIEQAAKDAFKPQQITDTTGNKSIAYTLDKIYFEPYKSTMLSESLDQLNALAAFMIRFPTVEILITGHTDVSGQELKNQILSEERARAVSAYLIELGVAPNRLTYKGLGSRVPIADNKTKEGRKLNRRVEFKILKQ